MASHIPSAGGARRHLDRPHIKAATPSARTAAALALCALLAVPHGVADASPVGGYYYFVHWFSVGRSDLALQQFTEDAVVVAGPDCTYAAPCVGRAAIRERYLGALTAGRAALPLQDARFDGQFLRTHGEAMLVHDAASGSSFQLRGGHRFMFRDGRIASLQVQLDGDDPATAAFAARNQTESASAAP